MKKQNVKKMFALLTVGTMVVSMAAAVSAEDKPTVTLMFDIPPYTLEDWIGIGYSKEMADKASAVYHVTEKTPPFLILHGDADNGVLPEQSEMMYEKLVEKGVYAEFYLLKGEGHGAAAFYQEQVNEIVDAFLEKALAK